MKMLVYFDGTDEADDTYFKSFDIMVHNKGFHSFSYPPESN